MSTDYSTGQLPLVRRRPNEAAFPAASIAWMLQGCKVAPRFSCPTEPGFLARSLFPNDILFNSVSLKCLPRASARYSCRWPPRILDQNTRAHCQRYGSFPSSIDPIPDSLGPRSGEPDAAAAVCRYLRRRLGVVGATHSFILPCR